jgi:hypothetical protein
VAGLDRSNTPTGRLKASTQPLLRELYNIEFVVIIGAAILHPNDVERISIKVRYLDDHALCSLSNEVERRYRILIETKDV